MSGLTGRFLTRDPIGYFDGLNVYRFLNKFLLRGIDPDGSREVPDPPEEWKCKYSDPSYSCTDFLKSRYGNINPIIPVSPTFPGSKRICGVIVSCGDLGPFKLGETRPGDPIRIVLDDFNTYPDMRDFERVLV